MSIEYWHNKEPLWPIIYVCKVCKRIQTMSEDGVCAECRKREITEPSVIDKGEDSCQPR